MMTKLLVLPLVFVQLPLAASALQVLATKSSTLLQWTCFGDEDADTITVESCCRGIHQASQPLQQALPDDCESQLAEVPSNYSLPLGTLARFSWVVSVSDKPQATNHEQRLWSSANMTSSILQPRAALSSPYILDSTVSPATLSLDSHLSSHGGMHRLLHHKAELDHTILLRDTLYLFLTIPQGMFVDLDDPVDSSEAWKLHSSKVCDIEQPAFVSGQHVIVLEFPSAGSSMEFTSKLHLRYPFPSPTYEQWIDLPAPQLIGVTRDDGRVTSSGNFEVIERVWVAAASDKDYDLAMWTTLAACWLGVIWMMADISYASQWDNYAK